MTPPLELARLRSTIDQLDGELLRILAQRRAVVAQVVELKTRLELPKVDPAREAEMRALLLKEGAGLGLSSTLVGAVLDAILEDSRGKVR